MGGIDAVRSKRGGKKRIRDTGLSLDPLPIAPELNVDQEMVLDSEKKTKKTRRGKRGGRSAVPLDDVADVLPTTDHHLENPERKRRREHDDETPIRRPLFTDNAISAEPELDVETRSYFESIEKVLDEQSFDDLSVLLANTYKEIDGKEVLITKDYSTSRILEKILQVSTDFQIRVFMERLSGQFLDLCQHQFSSHVCQTLLNLGADIAERELKGESVVELVSGVSNQLPSMEALIIAACQVRKS